MVIVDALSDELIEAYGENVYTLLQIYEEVYSPDLSIEISEEPGLFDFNVFGGDIGVAGFYVRPQLEKVLHRATQDLLFRISTDRGSSILFPSAGNVNISAVPQEAMKGIIAIAATESPFIEGIDSIRIESQEQDEVRIDIRGRTITGDSIHLGFNI